MYGDEKNIFTMEGFKDTYMVYCGLVKTMVDINFCLNGGPMQTETTCEHFRGIENSNEGEPSILIHAVPVAEKIMKSIIQEEK